MNEEDLFQELSSLVLTALKLDCPVLSGNMRANITYSPLSKTESQIVISAPSYDTSLWEKTGKIEYNGKYDYAVSVNNVGAFGGRSKKSKHWVNKSLEKTCKVIGSLYDAEVLVDVDTR